MRGSLSLGKEWAKVDIKAKLGKLFGTRGADTEFDKLGRELRTLGVKAKVIEEFERICRQYPDSAALGLDAMRGAISGARSNPDLDGFGLVMLESVVVGAMSSTVQHATGKTPNLSHLLS